MYESMLEWATGAMLAMWLALLTWTGKRQIERIDDLERNKANKQSTDKRFDAELAQLAEHIRDDREMHARLVKGIHDVNLKLERIAGQLEGQHDHR